MINVLSFRLFSWYSSGVFALIVVILILIYVIVFDDVFFLIITLFSSGMTLPVLCSSGSGCDGLLVALNIKPGAYSLGGYNPDTYNLPI